MMNYTAQLDQITILPSPSRGCSSCPGDVWGGRTSGCRICSSSSWTSKNVSGVRWDVVKSSFQVRGDTCTILSISPLVSGILHFKFDWLTLGLIWRGATSPSWPAASCSRSGAWRSPCPCCWCGRSVRRSGDVSWLLFSLAEPWAGCTQCHWLTSHLSLRCHLLELWTPNTESLTLTSEHYMHSADLLPTLDTALISLDLVRQVQISVLSERKNSGKTKSECYIRGEFITLSNTNI